MKSLDELFGETAEACRRWLLAWNEAKPSPSLASDRNHDRLMDVHNELEALVVEIAERFDNT